MDDAEFVSEAMLHAGDRLRLSNGGEAVVDEVTSVPHAGGVTTYNIAVADYCTYFVSSDEILVHNEGKLCDLAQEAWAQLHRLELATLGRAADLAEARTATVKAFEGMVKGLQADGRLKPSRWGSLRKAVHQLFQQMNETVLRRMAVGERVVGDGLEDLAKWRSELGLGNVGEAAADGKTYCMARADIEGGISAYGVNVKSVPRPGYGDVSPKHGEFDALFSLKEMSNGNLRGKKIVLNIEMEPCESYCYPLLPKFAREEGLSELIVKVPGKTGRWDPSVGEIVWTSI